MTIPLKVLDGIEADFSPPYRAAIHGVEYGNAVKIAWQSRRFWETDDHIYGGISWVKGPTSLVWYPSERMFSPKGILLGAYANRDEADRIASSRWPHNSSSPARRSRRCIPAAAASSKSPWRSPGQRCPTVSASRRATARRTTDYAVLSEPDGPFYFAGEHLSHIGAWQEGAILSARRTINMIDKQIAKIGIREVRDEQANTRVRQG